MQKTFSKANGAELLIRMKSSLESLCLNCVENLELETQKFLRDLAGELVFTFKDSLQKSDFKPFDRHPYYFFFDADFAEGTNYLSAPEAK